MKSPMTKLVPAILCLLILPCAGGWREMMDGRKSVPLEKEPTVESIVKEGKPWIRVTNVSPAAITYSGEAATSPSVFIEELHDGKWTSERWNWCGTGITQHPIQPGQSVEFPLRVGINPMPTRVFMILSSGAKSSLVLLHEKK